MDGGTLIVSSGSGAPLAAMLARTPHRACVYAASASEARRAMAADAHPLILIDAPLSDENGLSLALDLAAHTTSAVILLVPSHLLPLTADAALNAGVPVVGKPVAAPLLDQALRLALSMRNRLLLMSEENRRLARTLDDLRIVDRAKCLLIEHHQLTEENAHRLIEKRAMNQRVSRVRIARAILDKFEL